MTLPRASTLVPTLAVPQRIVSTIDMPRQPPAIIIQDNPDVVEPDDQHELERQAWYQNASNEALNVPNGYLKVAVLIVRWEEKIDDFKDHKNEISRLKEIFTDDFGYECNIVQLHNSTKPQHQLNLAIQEHVTKYDGPNNLLIVYYTGHGALVENESRLELSATQNYDWKPGQYQATAFWDTAERPLFDMEGDVLAILDCCFASSAGLKMRQEDFRTYQLLAASPAGSPTEGPGKNSFTTALNDSLSELIKETNGENFPLTKLTQRINLKRTKRACVTWDRLHKHKRQVQLARLAPSAQDRVASFESRKPERASLNLRLSLPIEDLEKDQIEILARQIPEACKEASIPVLRIDWVKMERSELESERYDLFKAVKVASTVNQARIAFRRNSVGKGTSPLEVPSPEAEHIQQPHARGADKTSEKPNQTESRGPPKKQEKRKQFPRKKRPRLGTLSNVPSQPQVSVPPATASLNIERADPLSQARI